MTHIDAVIYEPGGPEGPLHEANFARGNPRARTRERLVRWKPLGRWQHLRVGVAVVRDEEYEYGDRPLLSSPDKVAEFFRQTHMEDLDREVFVTILLDVRSRVIGVEEVAVGHLSGVAVHPREVFKSAIILGANGIILAHNHPSGEPEPSPDDLALTSRMQDAGRILGIKVVDSVVVGGGGQHVSLKERGMFD